MGKTIISPDAMTAIAETKIRGAPTAPRAGGTVSLKRFVGWLASKAGYDVIAHWRMEKLAQASYLREVLELGQIDCVFDVGANAGQYRDFLRLQTGFQGWIVSVEPIPDLVRELRARASGEPRWLVEECALGRTAGTSLLNVTRNTQYSSFLAPRAEAGRKFVDLGTIDRSLSVKVRTLDELFREVRERIGFSRPYLKLDTQGFDLEVIAGAGGCLAEFAALQLEASMRPIYEGMPGYAEAIAQLASLGFEPSGLFPNNPGLFPELIEFDCHFVKALEIPALRARYLAR